MADDARATAEKMWQEVMRFDAPPITDPYTEATTDAVFGTLWARPGLARRDRRLTSLTVIATRGLKEPLVAHLTAALSSVPEAEQCGWVKDRFGLSWQIVPKRLLALLTDPDAARARRAMQAMLTMKRIDIAAVERAAEGR